MSEVAYPVDLTGVAESNFIKDEVHTLTEINDATYRFIIPKFAPFYLNNFKLKYDDSNGTIIDLVEHVDYDLCLPYIGATRSIGQVVYGAVTIYNNYVNGVLKIDYQTVGGKWIADPNYVLKFLAEKAYNPRVVVWDIVTNVQETFPPTDHEHDFSQLKGQDELIAALYKVEEAILNPKGNTNVGLIHILNDDNPHNVTAEQIGLGNVVNIGIATETEVKGRQAVKKLVTLDQVIGLISDMMELGREQPDITKLYNLTADLTSKIDILNERLRKLEGSDA